jgi:hypothetical protein
MARLGFIFQSVSVVVVFLAALACASGDNEAGTGVTGGSMAGSGGADSTAMGDPPGPGSTATGTGGTGTGSGDPTTVEDLCGNGVIDQGEICDGTDLDNETCGTLAEGQVGTLSCSSDCLNYVTDLCYTPPDTDSGVQPDGGYGL